MDAIRATEEDAPTTELVTGVVGDRCANCQAPLAPDQRYCVNCGERRGRPRFSYESMAAQAAPAAAGGPVPPRQRARFSSGTTLVAGVATLLIAMGVGVLIGNDSNSTPARAPAPQVITVGGGAATGTTAGTGTTSGATTTGTAKTSKGKTKVVHVTAKTAKAATQAAGKVLGSSHSLSNNVTQQVGGSCTGGSGCQNGKFTGNFFPGG
jgi:hypothetical protein